MRPHYLIFWIAIALALVAVFNIWPSLRESRGFLVGFLVLVVGAGVVMSSRRRNSGP